MDKTVNIIFTSGSDKCDECGWYDWYRIDVEKLNGCDYVYQGDSHLGGGVPSPDDFVEGYKQALKDLGYKVNISSEYIPYEGFDE